MVENPCRPCACAIVCSVIVFPVFSAIGRGQSTASLPSIEAEIRQIDALGRSNPARAMDRLKALLARVEADTDLPDKRRETLKRVVADRIRVTSVDLEDGARKSIARLTDKDRRDAEANSSRRLFDAVRKLQKEGKLGEARRLAGKAADRLPDDPAAQALRRTTNAADQVAASRATQQEIARGVSGALERVDRTAIPPKGDVEYPKDWKARTAGRKSANAVPMTARERSILQALDASIAVNFKDSPLDAVLDYVRTVTGQPIVVNPDALEAANVTYETRITLRLPEVSLRFALRKILSELGLAYVVKDQTIQVVTAVQAREMLVTRTQYIGDMLTFLDEFRATLQASQLIELIESTIEPSSWKRNGGPGTIVYNHLTRSLVIKQTSEFQGTLSAGLP